MGLRSIKEIFITGHGPSSSHTMGPFFASQYILKKYKNATYIEVTLYGSLALTGKGHLTDYIIDVALKDVPHDIVFNKKAKTKHPNTMTFKVLEGRKKHVENIVSIGGGSIVTVDNIDELNKKDTYPHQYMTEIMKYCNENDLSFYEYVEKYEGQDIYHYFEDVLKHE